MSEFDPSFHLNPPTARTVREVRLNDLCKEALPYLVVMQQSDTGNKLAALVEAIVQEVG